ncbi:MAG: NAD(P)-dependent alcohol dehydrogenase [Pseudomonadaceae bacterium]|nr:NAD(P)-dependent alcohol dehydrogenase [Pseudomonadaceae bacterium]
MLSCTDIPPPTVANNDLLIDIEAVSVNRTDCAMITAKPFIMRFVCGLLAPKKPVPGTAFVGTVAATGAEVTQFSIGDRVMGFDDSGAQCWAEQSRYPEDGRIGLAPEYASALDIAACIEGIHYAENFLNKVPLKAGQSALVNGASGAIGSAMVQLLATRGIEVVATCRAKDAELVMSLGASRCIDYEREDFTADNERFDYVFDAVGKSTFRRCRKLLNPDGFFLASELGPWLQNLAYTLITPWLPGPTVRFPFPAKTRKSLAITKSLLEAGDFTAVIDQRHTFEQARQALTRAMSGDKVGNIVMTPGPQQGN